MSRHIPRLSRQQFTRAHAPTRPRADCRMPPRGERNYAADARHDGDEAAEAAAAAEALVDPHDVLRMLCSQRLEAVNESWEQCVRDAVRRVATTDLVAHDLGSGTSVFEHIARLFDHPEASPRARAILFRVLLVIVTSQKGIFDKSLHVVDRPAVDKPTQDAMIRLASAVCWCTERCCAISVVPVTSEDGIVVGRYRMADLLSAILSRTFCPRTAVPRERRPYFISFVSRTLTYTRLPPLHTIESTHSGPCFGSKFAQAVVAAEVWPDLTCTLDHFSDLFLEWGYTPAASLAGYNTILNTVLFTTITFYATFTRQATNSFGSHWQMELLKALGFKGVFHAARTPTVRFTDGTSVRQPAVDIEHPVIRAGQLFFWMFLAPKRVSDLLCADVQSASHAVAESAREWAPLLRGICDGVVQDPLVERAVRRTMWFAEPDTAQWRDDTALESYEAQQRSFCIRTTGSLGRVFYEDDVYKLNAGMALDNARMIIASTAHPRDVDVTRAPLCKRVRAVFAMILLSAKRPGGAHNPFGMLSDDLLVNMIFPHAFQGIAPRRASWFNSLHTTQKYGYTGHPRHHHHQ